jgi:hypothetical protein
VVELLRRYSNLDTFQISIKFLEKSLVRTDSGSFRVPSSRPQTTPPEPFKLDQRLKPETVAEIIARYEAGEPSTAIAAIFNISKGSVIRLLREAGVKIRKQGLTIDQIAEAADMYANGSHSQPSARTSVSTTAPFGGRCSSVA